MARERIAAWIRRELARHPPRAKSLVVTVWGDAIAPRGGAVWLGDLIRLLAPLRLNERLVRTSVYRLSREGWLAARPDGRRSLYRLTDAGRQRFEHAYRRIYSPPPTRWDGAWDIVLARDASLAPARRKKLKRELGWEGFGAIAPGVLARPARHPRGADVAEVVRALEVESSVVVLRARDAPDFASGLLRDQVRRSRNLARVGEEYRRFLTRFRPVATDLGAARSLDPEHAFVVRSLLIHAFRRVTLHDPQLPRELAPSRWPAPEAYALCRDIYRLVRSATEDHLTATLTTGNGPLPRAAPYVRQRFGLT